MRKRWLNLNSQHLGLALWLRNNWELWRVNPLTQYEQGLGIHPPDGMASFLRLPVLGTFAATRLGRKINSNPYCQNQASYSLTLIKNMFRLYQMNSSGNCYKIRLLLTQLEITFETLEIDILRKESRTPEFLLKNPNGRVPVLETPDGNFLAESNAILFYLSQDSDLFPGDKWLQAKVMEWLFFEQYSHEPYIATSRYWITLLGKADEYRDAINQKKEPGYAALSVMEKHLERNRFFVGERYTIADIGLFAYTHVAPEGGFDLTQFPAIQDWIQRIMAQPRYVSITDKC